MAKHIYIAKQAKGLKFRVTIDDKDVAVKFENGQFSTDDDDLAVAIDKSMKGAVGRFCQKADKAAALELAAQHQAMLQRTGGMKGGVTANAIKTAADTQKQMRDAELTKAGTNLKDQFDEGENLVLTSPGETVPSPGLASVPPVAPAVAKPGLKLGAS